MELFLPDPLEARTFGADVGSVPSLSGVAQLAERATVNRLVESSSLSPGAQQNPAIAPGSVISVSNIRVMCGIGAVRLEQRFIR